VEVEDYISRGDYRGALKGALKIENPLKRLVALAKILTAFPREEVLSKMLDTVEPLRSAPERALAYAILGRALYTLDRDHDAGIYFEEAIELAGSIGSARLRGEVLAGIARNLVLSDRYSEALELFGKAIELLQTSRAYSASVSSLITVARLVEKSADEIPNRMTVDFYRLARDVYSSLLFTLQARHLEEKMELVRDVLKRGKPVVEELLERGEVERAVEMMRFLPLEERAISMLELSYWLFLHDNLQLGRRTFEDALEIMLVGKFKPEDAELRGIGERFLRIGFLREPMIIAGLIRDEGMASELLGEIALSYARRGEMSRALSIAGAIGDESVKKRLLKVLEGEEGVGHEQGLPSAGGGEGGGTVPEDDRGG